MKQSEIINTIMFDYADFSKEEIVKLCEGLPNKMLRWLGANHPDNRTRKIFFRITNVWIEEKVVILQNFIVFDSCKKLLTIGKRAAIATNVTVICETDPNNSILKDHEYVKAKMIVSKPVTIGDDAWIGANVTILPGVKIGDRAIIAAGSIVRNNVAADTMYASMPDKVSREY